MTQQSDNSSLKCLALPAGEEARAQWGGSVKKIPSDAVEIKNCTQLRNFHKETDTVTLQTDSTEIHIGLPQLRDWLKTQGVTLEWRHDSPGIDQDPRFEKSEQTFVLYPGGQAHHFYNIKPGSDMSDYLG